METPDASCGKTSRSIKSVEWTFAEKIRTDIRLEPVHHKGAGEHSAPAGRRGAVLGFRPGHGSSVWWGCTHHTITEYHSTPSREEA